MAQMIGNQPFHAVPFAGRRFDCGSKAGFVEATLALALQREDLADEVLAIARRLVAETDRDNAARSRREGSGRIFQGGKPADFTDLDRRQASTLSR